MPRLRSLTSPALLGLALVAAASVTLRPAAQAPEPRVIDVIARRFVFEPAEIEATVGERIRLQVRSADGVHGLEIRTFKVKKEIPRGTTPVTIDFTASEEGRFPILCSEYCGDGHDDMTGMLVVRAEQHEPDPVSVRSVRLQPDQKADDR
jgi:cytochrome c oxidase subunit 2